MQTTLKSPVGTYQPEVLLIAPEAGEDSHTLSLVSQLLELGVPIELDEQWRVPTSPRKELSAYKTCLFPASSKPRYDRELDSFARQGGYLYRKYYPDTPDTSAIAIPHLIAYGRDLFFYGFVQASLTAGLTLNDPDFQEILRRRSHASILDVYRQRIAGQDAGQDGPLPAWGDRVYTRNCDDATLARFTRDPFWENTSRRFLERLRDSVDQVLGSSTDRVPPGRHLVMDYEGTSSHNPAMMGSVLMRHGQRLQDPSLTQAGIRVGTAYVRMSRVENNVVHQQRFHGNSVSELMCGVEVLCWLASVTGEVLAKNGRGDFSRHGRAMPGRGRVVASCGFAKRTKRVLEPGDPMAGALGNPCPRSHQRRLGFCGNNSPLPETDVRRA